MPQAQPQFLFDFGSPNAYLCHLVLPHIERRAGVAFDYVPVLLGGVFKLTGNVSPAIALQGIKNKPEYQALEMQRFVARHQIEAYRSNPHFPVNTLQLMRGAVAAQQQGIGEHYIRAVYAHMWAEPKKMDDPDVFRAALEESGLPATAILDAITSAQVKAQLVDHTQRAVDRGAFGSPSFLVGDELFFGKDRLADVEEEIARQRTAESA